MTTRNEKQSIRKRAAGSLALLCIVALLVGCPTPEEPSPEPTPPELPPVAEADLPPVVARLGNLSLQPLVEAHEEMTLASLENQVVLINLWGPWCGPCRVELPHMAHFSEKYAYKPEFRIITVAYPQARPTAANKPGVESDVKELFAALKIDGLPVWYDENGVTAGAVQTAVGFEGFPTTLLLDKSGGIRKTWTGYTTGIEKQMEELIDLLLRAGS